MPFRFKKNETVADGARRIALEQIDRALARIAESGADDPEAVHQTRKRITRTRALLRLLRGGALSKRVYSRDNAYLRDTARLLSDARDAEVALHTLNAFASGGDRPALSPDAADTLRARLRLGRDRSHGEETGGRLEAAAGGLREFRQTVEAWEIRTEGFDSFEQGVKRTQRRAREAYEHAREITDGAAMHEWRKRCKAARDQARLLRRAGDHAAARAGSLEDLCDILGEEHDLTMLRHRLAGEADPADAAGALADFFQAMEQRQAELRGAAFELGGRLMKPKPKKLARQLRDDWDDWRH